MLDTFFLSILDMTKAGSLVILAVLLARLLLRRVPKWIPYALWLVVLLRLLCPVEIQASVSLMPELTPTAQEYALEDAPVSFADAGIAAYQAVGDVLNGGIDVQHVPTQRVDPQGNIEYVPADMGDVWILFGSYIWAAGFFTLVLYSGISFLSLNRKLREAVRQEKGVYLAEGIDSPFVMGRRIYLPHGLEERERSYILAHERQHLRRLDPMWKLLGFLALCIHWFNPLVWIAFRLACRDMEMSCDEAVVKAFGPEIRGDYAASLLKVATGRRFISGAPLAFGEGDPKIRIRNLAKWKKPILWLSIVAVVLCAGLAVCLLTDPVKETNVGRSYCFGVVKALERDDPGTLILDCEDGRELEFRISPDYQVPPEISVGDTVMVRRAMHTEELVATQVALTVESMTATLEEAIENAILLMGGGKESKNTFPCASFAQISKEVTGIASPEGKGTTWTERVTVYGLALHQCYVNRNGTLQEASGSHIPVAITFRVSDGGQYVLEEYWMPRDGSYYATDLREKFGAFNMPDTQKYIKQQQAECLAKARAHFGIPEPGTEPQETVPPTTEKVYGFDISKIPDKGIVPLEELPDDYSREDAVRDKVVVIDQKTVYANAYQWEAFVQAVERGNPARVRLMNATLGVVGTVRDILFDGERFCMRGTVYYGSGELSHVEEEYYEHLQGFRWQNAMADGTVYEECIAYILCIRKTTELPEHLSLGWATEQGELLVYQQVASMRPNPQLPDNVVSAKITLENQVLATQTDKAKLASLLKLLSGGEFLTDANSYIVFEPLALVLETADGKQLRCPISAEQDYIRIDGSIYDYGPGMEMREGEPHHRNAILQMTRHFGLEDWPPALREYCLSLGIEPPLHSLKVLSGEEPHG